MWTLLHCNPGLGVCVCVCVCLWAWVQELSFDFLAGAYVRKEATEGRGRGLELPLGPVVARTNGQPSQALSFEPLEPL